MRINILTVMCVVPLLFGCGCALKTQKTTIFDESRHLKILNRQERNFVSALLATKDKSGIFDGQIDAVDINGFRILYNENSDEIYVVKNGKFVQIGGNYVIIYKNHPNSPAPGGTEQVVATDHSINYFGENFSSYDYGYNGVDLKYSKTNEDNPDYFIDNEFCSDSLAVSTFSICCRSSKLDYKGYSYSHGDGWQERNNPLFLEKCRGLFEK
jgi:hypothetical protein